MHAICDNSTSCMAVSGNLGIPGTGNTESGKIEPGKPSPGFPVSSRARCMPIHTSSVLSLRILTHTFRSLTLSPVSAGE